MEGRMQRIVLALGGNALGKTLPQQGLAVKNTVKTIADLIEMGHQVVITHGNGPQVGLIHLAMDGFSRDYPEYPPVPLSVCTAMSQGYIGYDLQNALREELLERGLERPVATVLTQVEVDPEDPAFHTPSKPIGAFLSQAEAQQLQQQGVPVMEDAGRGWRRVVASPRPKSIIEIDTIRSMLAAEQVAVVCGGGGIPVIRRGNSLRGAKAVIDKDFASALLARQLEADLLIILTAVEQVAIRFGKPDQQWLDHLTVEEARHHMENGEFAPGSMLPKVAAAVEFAASRPGRRALITLLEKAKEGVQGKTGTVIG